VGSDLRLLWTTATVRYWIIPTGGIRDFGLLLVSATVRYWIVPTTKDADAGAGSLIQPRFANPQAGCSSRKWVVSFHSGCFARTAQPGYHNPRLASQWAVEATPGADPLHQYAIRGGGARTDS
jgi:hypothetical protein